MSVERSHSAVSTGTSALSLSSEEASGATLALAPPALVVAELVFRLDLDLALERGERMVCSCSAVDTALLQPSAQMRAQCKLI